jgi:hypothetical protein
MDLRVTTVVTVSGNNTFREKCYALSPVDCKVSRCERFAKEQHREKTVLVSGYVDCAMGCIL